MTRKPISLFGACVVLLLSVGCSSSVVEPVLVGSQETTVALRPHTIKTGGRVVRGSMPVLSLRLHGTKASPDETITAMVAYSNETSTTAVVLYGGSYLYNVRVRTPSGNVVFDNGYRSGASLIANSKVLAPGETISGSVGFRLREPGTYAVTAYNDLETPPISLIVALGDLPNQEIERAE